MDVINENTEYYPNTTEDYKNKSIDQYNNQIKELLEKKHEYIEKIDQIQNSICLLNEKKESFCHSMGGHEWVKERESGMYGELFTYCKKCKKGC
jgi:hypothetical protein